MSASCPLCWFAGAEIALIASADVRRDVARVVAWLLAGVIQLLLAALLFHNLLEAHLAARRTRAQASRSQAPAPMVSSDRPIVAAVSLAVPASAT